MPKKTSLKGVKFKSHIFFDFYDFIVRFIIIVIWTGLHERKLFQ